MTNCCDDYGNCRQGRDCPVRVERMSNIRDKHKDPIRASCIQNITIILIVLLVGLVAFLYHQAL